MIDLNSRTGHSKEARDLEQRSQSSKSGSVNKENSGSTGEDEAKDLRNKLRIMTTKFQAAKKELVQA